MDAQLILSFTSLWEHYFPGAELPLAFFYSDSAHGRKHGGELPDHRLMAQGAPAH